MIIHENYLEKMINLEVLSIIFIIMKYYLFNIPFVVIRKMNILPWGIFLWIFCPFLFSRISLTDSKLIFAHLLNFLSLNAEKIYLVMK